MNMIRRKFLQSTKKSPSGNYIFLEPNENIPLRREGEDEDIAVEDIVTIDELLSGNVSPRIIKSDNFIIKPYQFFNNQVLEEIDVICNYSVDDNGGQDSICLNSTFLVSSDKEISKPLRKVILKSEKYLKFNSTFNNYSMTSRYIDFIYINANLRDSNSSFYQTFVGEFIIQPINSDFEFDSVQSMFSESYGVVTDIFRLKCETIYTRFEEFTNSPFTNSDNVIAHFIDVSELITANYWLFDFENLEVSSLQSTSFKGTIINAEWMSGNTTTQKENGHWEWNEEQQEDIWVVTGTKTVGFGYYAPDFYYCKLINTFTGDIDFSTWKPTNALSENTDLVEWKKWDLEADGETPIDCTQFTTNKEKFLYCFRNLTLPAFENTSGETRELILSQEMYDVISQEQDIMDFFTQNNWNVSVLQ